MFTARMASPGQHRRAAPGRDGAIWTSTLGAGAVSVKRTAPASAPIRPLTGGLEHRQLDRETGDGTVWFATSQGLSAFAGGQWRAWRRRRSAVRRHQLPARRRGRRVALGRHGGGPRQIVGAAWWPTFSRPCCANRSSGLPRTTGLAVGGDLEQISCRCLSIARRGQPIEADIREFEGRRAAQR